MAAVHFCSLLMVLFCFYAVGTMGHLYQMRVPRVGSCLLQYVHAYSCILMLLLLLLLSLLFVPQGPSCI
jgi:hypothetical protein